MRARPLSVGLAVVLFATLAVAARPAAADGRHGDEVARLHALFGAEWERTLRDEPVFASSLGDRRYNDRWEDLRPEAFARSQQKRRTVLRRLAGIRRDALPAAEQLNYDLFRRQYTEAVEGYRFHEFLTPIGERWGIQLPELTIGDVPFENEQDYRDWTARLRAMKVRIDRTIALMKQGLREGRTPPRIVLRRVPDQIRAQIVDDPEQSPFFKPYRQIPAAVPAVARPRLRNDGRAAVADVVIPAYRRLLRFFEDRYLPGSRTTIAASELPDGDAYYAHAIRSYTTTDLAADAIHQLGLAEVKRIRGEMDAQIRKIGFQGTFADFLRYLRTDDGFYYANADDLLAGYRDITRRIEPQLGKLFGRLPTIPLEVQPIPAAEAPASTAAYYSAGAADGSRPGTVYVNLDQLHSRPKYEMEALMAHEGVPGHHLQLSLALEQGELPMFRRYGDYTAFVEGWGLYSESLGDELGLYRDAYSRFGQLTLEMWRAVRLVVDTGIHAKGWSRQQAIDYFTANAARSEHDIANEVDRYIGWPGQALAYKIGQLKISELRHRAEEKLGARFDVKAFHDLVLGSGALPLDLLEARVDSWLAG
jgi:uncharacterized protein (DUF885 family)